MLGHPLHALKPLLRQLEERRAGEQRVGSGLQGWEVGWCVVRCGGHGGNGEASRGDCWAPVGARTWCCGPMRATSSVSASLFSPPCRLSQNFMRYLMSKICGKKSCGVSVGMSWVGMSWGWVRLGECEGEGRWVESGGGVGWGGEPEGRLGARRQRQGCCKGSAGYKIHASWRSRQASIPQGERGRSARALSSSKNSASLAGSDWQVSSLSR